MGPEALWGKGVNRGLAAGAALVALVWVIKLGSGPSGVGAFIALVLAPSLALYLLAVALLVEWAVLRVFRRGTRPHLPFVPERWHQGKAPLVALTCFVAFITITREGAFAPDFVLTYNWFERSHSINSNSNSSTNSSTMGDSPPIAFSDRPLRCEVFCSPAGTTCDGFVDTFGCDDADRASGAGVVQMTITAHLPEASCYFPLSKSASESFTVDASASLSDSTGNRSGSFNLNGNIEQSVEGLMSCYTFRWEMGQALGHYTTAEIDGFLASN